MEILVDHQAFLMQKFGGISRYHATLSNYINKLKHNSVICSIGCNNAYSQTQLATLKILDRRGGRGILNNINRINISLKVRDFDVFHPTLYDPYFLSIKNLPPYVVTVHDMIPELLLKKEQGALIEGKRKIVEKASAIIAISQATKKDLTEIYNIDPKLIHVIYHGYPEYFEKIKRQSTVSVADEIPPENRYILFLGLRGNYKNFSSFIDGVAPFMLKNNINLKVLGEPGKTEEINQLEKRGISDLTYFIDHVSEEELYLSYNRAFCFVFPSRAEGFGMPLLEAFIAKCPVVCSDIPIFKEICEDAALFFDPQDMSTLGGRLQQLLDSENLRSSMTSRGESQVRKFTWKSAAAKTIDAYELALGKC